MAISAKTKYPNLKFLISEKRYSQKQIAESIGAVIDINDRYGFNNDPEYRSDSSELQALLRSMSNIINNKLHTLIQRGEY